jgi:predicted transposase YdaD
VLYERLVSESALYFYRNRKRFCDWQVVAIFPSRSMEQSDTSPYQVLIDGGKLHRVYLDELGEASQLPVSVALVLLTIATKRKAPGAAKELMSRAGQESLAEAQKLAIMEMVVKIISYKFTKLSQVEVEKMLDIRFEETQVYKDIRQGGQEAGREEEALNLVLRQLRRRLGKELPSRVRSQVSKLSLVELEELGEALLDFEAIGDLKAWLVGEWEG